MRFSPPLISLFLIPFFSVGCSSVSTRQLERVPAQIERGSTTKQEVVALLGEPDHRRFDPAGETWTYGNDRHGSPEQAAIGQAVGIGAGFTRVPYLGAAINGARTIGRTSQSAQPAAAVTFDKAGIVSDYLVEIPGE